MTTHRKPKNTVSPKRFFLAMDNDPEIRISFALERAKTDIAYAVKTARKNAHLTQAALAKKVGTTQSAIARLESGTDHRTPTLPLLARIAAACNSALEIIFKKAS